MHSLKPQVSRACRAHACTKGSPICLPSRRSLRAAAPIAARKVKCSATEEAGNTPSSPSSTTQVETAGVIPPAEVSSTTPSSRASPSAGFPAAQAFQLLVATSSLLALLSIGTPELLLHVCYGIEPNYADVAFLRIAGAGLLLSVAVEYSLKDAAEHNRLSSMTYQRLLVIGAIKSVMFGGILALSPAAWTPAVLAFYPLIAIAGTAIYSLTFLESNDNKFVLPDLALSIPTNSASWIYTIFFLLYLATAATAFAPEALFTRDAITPQADFLKHTWAPSFLAAAGVCWVQKDAADRGRLGATTFKWLNLGLAGLEIGFSGVIGASILSGHVAADSMSLPSIAGSVVITSYTLYQYFTAKK